jgi:hypothetical protein
MLPKLTHWFFLLVLDFHACSSPLIAFKNLPSGDVGTNAWSVKSEAGRKLSETVTGKLVSTGVYSFYRDEFGMNLGEVVPAIQKGYNITADASSQGLQNCLNACDNEVII